MKTTQRPLLQVALDQTDLEAALRVAGVLAPEVDVLEAGTILCYAEGRRAFSTLRALYPEKIIVADFKAADAGGTVAEIAYSGGADWMTVICCAPIPTMEAALEKAKHHGGEVQIELYGNWTFEQAEDWKNVGLKQVIYHRGRDAELAGQKWSPEDLEKIRRLAGMGFEVSITGGLSPGNLDFFTGIPVQCFIAGRGLYGAEDPVETAGNFKTAIQKGWG